MSSEQTTDLTDFTSSKQSSNSSDTDTNSSEQSRMDEIICCDCYIKERSRSEWKQLQDTVGLSEPPCGHAINYFIYALEPLLDDNSVKKPKISQRSAKSYASAQSGYVGWCHHNDIPVVDAEFDDIEEYIDQRAALELTKETLKLDRTAIKNLYKHIDREYSIDLNFNWAFISEEINLSQYRVPDTKEREPLSKEELKELFEAAPQRRDQLIIIVGAECGPRNIDICKIKIDDLNTDKQEILLNDTKNDDEYPLPITDELNLYLKHWLERGRPAMNVDENNNFLFPSEQEGRLSRVRLLQIVQECAEKTGLQEIVREIPKSARPHEHEDIDDLEMKNDYWIDVHLLRHSFTKLLEDQNVPEEIQREALNHDSMASTRIYKNNKEKYRQYLDDMLSGSGYDVSW